MYQYQLFTVFFPSLSQKMPLSKKALLDFFSRLRRRRSNERTGSRDTEEEFSVTYQCDECFAGIKV